MQTLVVFPFLVLASVLSLVVGAGANVVNMGCYKDFTSTGRLLSGKKTEFKQTLTVQTCIEHCRQSNFKYAGVEYRFECYCSNEHPSYKWKVEEKDCHLPCDGNQKEICGGNLRINVYNIPGGAVSGLNKQYVGCFKDDNNRMLKGARYNSALQSPDFCMGLCYLRGFRLAGVQNSNECFCGDRLLTSARAPNSDCSRNCAGNPAYKCGGNWRLSIYHTGIPDLPSDDNYLGCFKDDVENVRLLSGMRMELKQINTPRKCMNICLANGYHFSGVEFGYECFCGNRKPKPEKETEEKHCNIPCPGNRELVCGGSSMILVYSTGYGKLSPVTGGHSTPVAPVRPPTSGTRKPVCDQSLTTVLGKPACKGQLIFAEQFRGPKVAMQKWSHSVLMPWIPDYEFVIFNEKEQNTYIRDGKLFLKPTILEDSFVKRGKVELQDCTGQQYSEECQRQAATFNILPPVESARISTKDSFSFRYGVVQITAKLPVGDWIVPELWLKPKRKTYGLGYASGRIRLAQARGNANLLFEQRDIGCSLLESGILMGVNENIRGRTAERWRQGGWHQQFHNFTFIWTPDSLSFIVDGEEEESLVPGKGRSICNLVGFTNKECETWKSGSSIAPFDKEFYISLGLSVGGMRDFPDGCRSGNVLKPWKNNAVKALANFWLGKEHWASTWKNEDSALQVDNIKVFALR